MKDKFQIDAMDHLVPFIDNGGRRSHVDRRRNRGLHSLFDRRSNQDRRKIVDRRKILNQTRANGPERRKYFKIAEK